MCKPDAGYRIIKEWLREGREAEKNGDMPAAAYARGELVGVEVLGEPGLQEYAGQCLMALRRIARWHAEPERVIGEAQIRQLLSMQPEGG